MKNYLIFLFVLNTISCVSLIDNPPTLGVDDQGNLEPCPDKPNCVSTQSQSQDHFLTPVKVNDVAGVFQKIKTYSEQEFNVTWVKEDSTYLRGVFVTSLMRYPDDVEFYYDGEKGLLHFRSASRFGYSDMGKNRKRMDVISKAIRNL